MSAKSFFNSTAFKCIVVLLVIALVCGAVLAVIYYLWFYERYDGKGRTHGDADAASES